MDVAVAAAHGAERRAEVSAHGIKDRFAQGIVAVIAGFQGISPEGRVRLGDQPYQWEAEEMVQWRDPSHAPDDRAQVAQARASSQFSVS